MPVTFVMIADLQPGTEAAFQRYESLVLPLLARHGGRLERRLRTDDALTEVHILSFETQSGYESYVADEQRQAHRGVLAEGSVTQRLLPMQEITEVPIQRTAVRPLGRTVRQNDPATQWPVPVIRRASADDASILAHLNGIVQAVHHQALPAEFLTPDAQATERFFADQLRRAVMAAWVAEVDGRAVGYVFVERLERAANAFTAARSALYVHHLAVDEPARRHGIARRLMSAVETEARRQGVDDIRLDYWTFNAAAREFFGAMGYEPYNVRARLALE